MAYGDPIGLYDKLPVVGASRGKMPLESNGVDIDSRRVHAESVVSAFQHPTYTTKLPIHKPNNDFSQMQS